MDTYVKESRSWLNEPRELSSDLNDIIDQPLRVLKEMYSYEYTEVAGTFERYRDDFHNSYLLTSRGLTAYIRTMYSYIHDEMYDIITVGELAFVAGRYPYSITKITSRFWQDMMFFRKFVEPHSALAWAIMLHADKSEENIQSFTDISFADAARYVAVGITDGTTIRSMIANGVDTEIVSQLANQ